LNRVQRRLNHEPIRRSLRERPRVTGSSRSAPCVPRPGVPATSGTAYDVLSSAEARERAAGKPWSFLHISKPRSTSTRRPIPRSRGLRKASENLDRMVKAGVLMRERHAVYYVYRLTWRDRIQTGLAAIASSPITRPNRVAGTN